MTMDDDANSLLLESMPPKRALRDRIDFLSVSADAKALPGHTDRLSSGYRDG